MRSLFKHITLWLWGGCLYYLLEIAWRGRSHPSMFIVGGLCFVLLGGINNWLPWSMGLVWQSLIGTVAVTVVEFLAGLIINVRLGLAVWDYANMPLNILGQACLPFAAAWIPISALGIILDDWLRHWIFDEEKPRYKLI
jgi:uncharacterized membrane protein